MYRMRLFACAENTSLLKIKLHKSKCVDILLIAWLIRGQKMYIVLLHTYVYFPRAKGLSR